MEQSGKIRYKNDGRIRMLSNNIRYVRQEFIVTQNQYVDIIQEINKITRSTDKRDTINNALFEIKNRINNL